MGEVYDTKSIDALNKAPSRFCTRELGQFCSTIALLCIMYSREERYRSMSQATPWTVGPSASRDFEPPAAADDPMLQIAASAHAKIAGHNGLGNPKMVRGQRGRG